MHIPARPQGAHPLDTGQNHPPTPGLPKGSRPDCMASESTVADTLGWLFQVLCWYMGVPTFAWWSLASQFIQEDSKHGGRNSVEYMRPSCPGVGWPWEASLRWVRIGATTGSSWYRRPHFSEAGSRRLPRRLTPKVLRSEASSQESSYIQGCSWARGSIRVSSGSQARPRTRSSQAGQNPEHLTARAAAGDARKAGLWLLDAPT